MRTVKDSLDSLVAIVTIYSNPVPAQQINNQSHSKGIIQCCYCCCQVWTEQINKRGAVNFITGAGGFLQAVIYGYGGFRLRENRLDFYPTLPRSCRKLTIRGVHYMGNKLEFEIKKKMFGIRLISKGPISPRLEVVMIYKRKERYTLRIGEMFYLYRGRGFLRIPRHDK